MDLTNAVKQKKMRQCWGFNVAIHWKFETASPTMIAWNRSRVLVRKGSIDQGEEKGGKVIALLDTDDTWHNWVQVCCSRRTTQRWTRRKSKSEAKNTDVGVVTSSPNSWSWKVWAISYTNDGKEIYSRATLKIDKLLLGQSNFGWRPLSWKTACTVQMQPGTTTQLSVRKVGVLPQPPPRAWLR